MKRLSLFLGFVVGFVILATIGFRNASAQPVPGSCGSNSNPCSVVSLKTAPVGYGALPACTTQLRGTVEMTLDAGYRYCDGTWLAFGSGSGGSGGTDTCTGATCNIGVNGVTTDGGFVSYAKTVASFSGSPNSGIALLQNPNGLVEIFGKAEYDGGPGPAPDFECDVLLSGRNNPQRLTNNLACFFNLEDNKASVKWDGTYYTTGGFTAHGSGAQFKNDSAATIIRGTAGAGADILLVGNSGGSGNLVEFYQYPATLLVDISTDGTVESAATGSGKRSFYANGGQNSYGLYQDGAGNLAHADGVLLANLGTCNNSTHQSDLQYVTDQAAWYYCNGTSWTKLASGSPITNYYETYAAVCPAADTTGCQAEETNFYGPLRMTGGESSGCRVTCNWLTPGTGGSTGVVAAIYGVAEAADMCTCTLGACNTAKGTAVSCSCNATLVSGRTYQLQFDSTTDCTGNPSETHCNVECFH